MLKIFRFILILTVIVQLHSSISFAETPSERHEVIKKSYFRLKNIDPEVSDADAWKQVIFDYESFIKKGSALEDKVFFEYGSVLQEYGIRKNEASFLQSANSTYDELRRRYPSSSLTDDAMLRQSEILIAQGASSDAIKNSLNQIIKVYPDSDSAEIARARLVQSGRMAAKEVLPQASDTVSALINDLPVVVIDPGHGGEDFGAENDLGLLEKDVVLSIALEAEKLINSKGLARVLLTRKSDIFIPLPDRIELANKNSAALFISLHNNASLKRNQYGMTSYVLDDSSDEASLKLAERENKSAGVGAATSDLDFIVSDLIQSSKHPKSILLAQTLEKALMKSVKTHWKDARSLGIKKAPFYVLVGARMPCALLELFFLDHQSDGERLSDPLIRKSIGAGIAKGIEDFLSKSDA